MYFPTWSLHVYSHPALCTQFPHALFATLYQTLRVASLIATKSIYCCCSHAIAGNTLDTVTCTVSPSSRLHNVHSSSGPLPYWPPTLHTNPREKLNTHTHHPMSQLRVHGAVHTLTPFIFMASTECSVSLILANNTKFYTQ